MNSLCGLVEGDAPFEAILNQFFLEIVTDSIWKRCQYKFSKMRNVRVHERRRNLVLLLLVLVEFLKAPID